MSLKFRAKPKEPEVVEVWQLTKCNWRDLEALGTQKVPTPYRSSTWTLAIRSIGNWKDPEDVLGLLVTTNSCPHCHGSAITTLLEFGDYLVKDSCGFYVVKEFLWDEWQDNFELIQVGATEIS